MSCGFVASLVDAPLEILLSTLLIIFGVEERERVRVCVCVFLLLFSACVSARVLMKKKNNGGNQLFFTLARFLVKGVNVKKGKKARARVRYERIC